jgi:hypothetical protein
MKTALRVLGVAGLMWLTGMTGCVLVGTAATYPGYGGAGVDLAAAEQACRRTAHAIGLRGLGEVEAVRITERGVARLRFDRYGLFNDDVVCSYNFATGVTRFR